jgi:hypothetical protein
MPMGIGVRLFLTCWIVFVLHFATNTVREIYLALAIGDHFSFRVDEYAGMHPDLFEKPGYGWHIGANPGASMLAAIPYSAAKPLIDRVVERVNRQRAAAGTPAPSYESPWPMAQKFYQDAWRRGFDVKFGLSAFVMQAFCMAPISALAVVVMYFLLGRLLKSDKLALWLSFLYAFGTPVFFRTGYLSHNLLLGHIAFFGFVYLWNLSGSQQGSYATRSFVAGLAGGIAILFDYSGVILLGGLFLYCITKASADAEANSLQAGLWYAAGSMGPIGLLWFYQWRSFGHMLYPGQHWMPPVAWIERGYQGFSGPQLDLFASLLLDYRFGLFVTAPILALAFLYPVLRKRQVLPRLEFLTMVGVSIGLIVFFSGVHYTRLQFNTGIRYLAPVFPFLFIPAAMVIACWPTWARYAVTVVLVVQNWCLAMHRDVERGMGILDPIASVFLGGFQLPALTAISRMQAYREFFPYGPSPLPLFVLTTAILYGVWSISSRQSKT